MWMCVVLFVGSFSLPISFISIPTNTTHLQKHDILKTLQAAHHRRNATVAMQRNALQTLVFLHHLLHNTLLHPTLAHPLRPVKQRVLEAAKQTMVQRHGDLSRLLLLSSSSLRVHGHPHRVLHSGGCRQRASEERIEACGVAGEHGNDVDTTENVAETAEHDETTEVDGVFESRVEAVLRDLHQTNVAVEEREQATEVERLHARQGRKRLVRLEGGLLGRTVGNGVVATVVETLLEERVVAERFEVFEDVDVADVEDVDEVDRTDGVKKRKTGLQLELVHLQHRQELVHAVDSVDGVDDLFVLHRVGKEADDLLGGIAAKRDVEIVRLRVTDPERNGRETPFPDRSGREPPEREGDV